MGFSNPQADRMCRTSTIEFSGTAASISDLIVMFMHPSEIHRVSNPQADRMSKLGMNSPNSAWYESQQADAVSGGGRKRPERRRYSAWTRWRPCKANWQPDEVFRAREMNLRRMEKSMRQ
ncbi:hypothetical protein MRB53_032209 [Persea americana]|uniref:Uncharacterized protein n=1 Tax=Persea americana TaxID=3435 RepID=A0ACC2KR82_PERAE|nr:hypothetical protein MRB53_032209 [Persea americana]